MNPQGDSYSLSDFPSPDADKRARSSWSLRAFEECEHEAQEVGQSRGGSCPSDNQAQSKAAQSGLGEEAKVSFAKRKRPPAPPSPPIDADSQDSATQLDKLLKGKRGWDLSERPLAVTVAASAHTEKSSMSGSKEGATRNSERTNGTASKIRRTKSRHATAEGQRENASSLRKAYEKKKALIPQLVRWNNLCFYMSMLGIVLTITDMELSRHFYQFNPKELLVPLVLQCIVTTSTILLMFFL